MINQASVSSNHIAILKAKSILEENGFTVEQKFNNLYLEDKEKAFNAKLYLELEREFDKHFFRIGFYHNNGVTVISHYKYK